MHQSPQKTAPATVHRGNLPNCHICGSPPIQSSDHDRETEPKLGVVDLSHRSVGATTQTGLSIFQTSPAQQVLRREKQNRCSLDGRWKTNRVRQEIYKDQRTTIDGCGT